MRPTARARHNPVLRTGAKLCRQYLKWFGNASYKPVRNGEHWLLDALRTEPIRTVLDVGANVGSRSLRPETAARRPSSSRVISTIVCRNPALANRRWAT